MKKVLFLIHDLGYGGAEKVLVNLANNLDKNRFDITIKTLFDVGANKQFINNDVHYIGGWKHMFRGNAPLMSLFSPKTLDICLQKCGASRLFNQEAINEQVRDFA